MAERVTEQAEGQAKGQVSDQVHQVFDEEVVLITGAARRMGAVLARQFHAAGARVVIHYRQSQDAARALASELEDQRPRSVHLVRQPLGDQRSAQHLIMRTIRAWGRLDVLVNNASTVLPTPLDSLIEAEVTSLLTSNFLAPLYVSQAAVPYLQQHEGCIANLIDIHARQALADHSVYCASRAALSMLTQTLAVDLAPLVRVNGVEAGKTLWVEEGIEIDRDLQADMPASAPMATQDSPGLSIPMANHDSPESIAALVVKLCSLAGRDTTGQILAVNGERSPG